MMRHIFFIFICFLPLSSFSQNIHKLLMQQVEAYNRQDTASLLFNVSDDFIWYSVTSDTMTADVEGKKAFQEFLAEYYKGFEFVASEILQYHIVGNRISFVERVSYNTRGGESGTSMALGIYEFEKGKISRVWYY